MLFSRKFYQRCVTVNFHNFHTVQHHTVEKQEILSHQNFFRQINSLVTYLVKLLLSRNFW